MAGARARAGHGTLSTYWAGRHTSCCKTPIADAALVSLLRLMTLAIAYFITLFTPRLTLRFGHMYAISHCRGAHDSPMLKDH